MGADVIAINDQPDGWNINDGCGATRPDVVATAVLETGADGGVALDGDADRAIFADAAGRVIDGDQVLAAFALAAHDAGDLPGNLVVATVMSNLGLRLCMEEAGVLLVEARVGDRYVLEEMLRTGAVLGGEQSGHVIFLRHANTGDGLLTALRFLALAAGRGTPIADVAALMRRYPQVLQNVVVADREALDDNPAVWDAVRKAEEALENRGRVLVRASGTEPLVRVMVEAATEDEAVAHAEAISGAVRAALG